MKKLLSTLVILMMTITAWAIEPVKPTVGDGSTANPYQIGTAGNLIWFAQQVNDGTTAINGKLTADIDLGNDQTMIGTSDYLYNGTFDGDGHTVTVNYYGMKDCTALFRYINNTTIKNLKTAGSITTGYMHAAGIAGECYGTCFITNCASSVAITSTFTSQKKAEHGGIVAYCNKSVTLTHVIFNGKLLGSNATYCGGLIGCTEYPSGLFSDLEIGIAINCIFCPSEVTVSDTDSETLICGAFDSIKDCYYTTTLGDVEDVEGTAIAAETIASGEACFILNGGDTGKNDGTQAWYQNLDNSDTPDATPLPFNTHGTVYGGDGQCPHNTFSNTQRLHNCSFNDGIGECSNPGCTASNCYQPATLVDGVYEIANKGNLIWFANKVNEGATTIKGKLTANIDLGDDQTMIGTSNHMYNGIFDGGGHTVTVNYTATEDNTALFRYVSWATIKNLNTRGRITTGYKYAAGIVAESNGTTYIDRCASRIEIVSTFTTRKEGVHGGIVANNRSKVYLTDVLFYGGLYGDNTINCGGMIGWSETSATFTNCLFNPLSTDKVNNDGAKTLARGNGISVTNSFYLYALGETQGTATTFNDLCSGKVCFALNEGKCDGTQAWYQTIEGFTEESTPFPFNTHGTIYGGEDQCPLDLESFSNTKRPHSCTYVDGVGECSNPDCTISKCYQPATLVDGVYEIANKGNLIWFANKVNGGKTNIDGKLTADINLGADQTMIGTSSHMYNGTFDGNGHTVTVSYTATKDNDGATALFCFVNGATIKNLRTAGSITTKYLYAAGIVAESKGTTKIDNCVSSVTIDATFESLVTMFGSKHGGIVAQNKGNINLTNVIFNGKLLGEYAISCGGLIGDSGNNAVTISNCLFCPSKVTFHKSDAATLARGKNVTINNSYYSATLGDAQGTATTAEAVASGELCYTINVGNTDGTQAWYQNIDNSDTPDATPLPFDTHATVYGGEHQCPLYTYSNTSKPHICSYVDGVGYCTNQDCTVSQYNQPANLVDGVYEIANKGNLLWFANMVNGGTTNIEGRLTADINLGDDQTMIGASSSMYNGTFDGNGHTITVNYTTDNDVAALFRYVENATIKNLTTAGSINTSNRNAAGVAGKCLGVTMQKVISSVVINSTYEGDATHGGIVADSRTNDASFTDCAFIGQLKGASTTNCAGLVGHHDSGALSLTNCYVAPSADFTISTEGCKTLVRNGKPIIKNCYYAQTLGDAQGTAIAAEGVASGELCYMLNRGKTDGTQVWYQNLGNSDTPDATPVFDNTHGTVYGGEEQCPAGSYSNEAHSHNFDNYGEIGISNCSNSDCAAISNQPAKLDASDNYLIANKGNLLWFAQKVNAGRGSINAKLTADVDLGDDQTTIGTKTNMYSGIFDGNAYSITVHYTATDHVTALFPYTLNATIKNLMTKGTISTAYKDAAGVAGQCYGIKLDKVVSTIAINSTYEGDATHGGLVGVCHSYDSSLTDCAFIGQLNGEKTTNCAGLVGHHDSGALSLKNCYVAPSADFTVSTEGCKTLVRHGNPTITNCYYTQALGGDQGIKASEPEVMNGMIVLKLGRNVWYHDTDLKRPLPFGLVRLGKSLRLTALADGSITIQQKGTVTATLQLTDNGINWTDVPYDTPISLTEGQSIFLRAKGENGKNATLNSDANYLTFTSTMDVAASQSVMSLLDASCKQTEVPVDAFYRLFCDWSHLTQAPELPAVVLHNSSYHSMFQNCTGLTSIPDLSHVTLPYDCISACQAMFAGCTNLKVNTLGLGSEWVIHAESDRTGTTNDCFFQMFYRTGGNLTNINTGTPQKDVVYYIYNDEPYTCQTTDEWETIVLPFDVAYDAENTNHKLFHLVAVNDDNFTFKEYATGTIPAGTPMAVKAIGEKDTDGKYTISIPSAYGKFSGDITEQTSTNASLPAGWTMNGTYGNTDKTGIYYIAHDKVLWAEDPITIAPFRAWMTGPEPSSTNAFNIIIGEGGETTGISTVNNEESLMNNGKYLKNGSIVILKNGKKYNTNGQRLK